MIECIVMQGFMLNGYNPQAGETVQLTLAQYARFGPEGLGSVQASAAVRAREAAEESIAKARAEAEEMAALAREEAEAEALKEATRAAEEARLQAEARAHEDADAQPPSSGSERGHRRRR